MKKILILLVFLLYSCAKPLVIETIQPGDDLLNCTELKQEIEEAKKLNKRPNFQKDQVVILQEPFYFGRHGHNH